MTEALKMAQIVFRSAKIGEGSIGHVAVKIYDELFFGK